MKYCMYCGKELQEGEICTCQNGMGNVQQNVTGHGNCKKCGAPLQPNDKICNVCGTPVENIGQPQNQQPQQGFTGQPQYQQPQQGFSGQQQNQQPQQSFTDQQQNQQPQQGFTGQSQYQQPQQGFTGQPQNQQPQQGFTGQPQNQQPQQNFSSQQQHATPKKKKSGKTVIVSLVLVCVLAAVGAAGVYVGITYFNMGELFGLSGSYKKVVKNYCEGKFGGDIDKMFETFPDEAVAKLSSDSSFNAMKESMKAVNQASGALFGKNYKYSYKIADGETLSKEEIENLTEKYEDADMKLQDSISEAKTVEVSVKGSLNGADMDMGTYTITCVKVGKKWYIDYFSAIGI